MCAEEYTTGYALFSSSPFSLFQFGFSSGTNVTMQQIRYWPRLLSWAQLVLRSIIDLSATSLSSDSLSFKSYRCFQYKNNNNKLHMPLVKGIHCFHHTVFNTSMSFPWREHVEHQLQLKARLGQEMGFADLHKWKCFNMIPFSIITVSYIASVILFSKMLVWKFFFYTP